MGNHKKEVRKGMYMMLYGLLTFCSLMRVVTMTPVTSSENQTCPEPEIGESRTDVRLPFYTSGFE